MDIYCPNCREPWDLDTLHEVADEVDSTFDAVRRDFRSRGCVALLSRCGTPAPAGVSNLIGEVMDLLGDDIDGTAAMLEDAEMMGLLD